MNYNLICDEYTIMKKALFTSLFLALLICINGYAQTTNQYKPAVFADENRKAKLNIHRIIFILWRTKITDQKISGSKRSKL